ncbi:MAG: hypothetical protein ABIQ70_00615 [Dokdonella sp.]
MLARFRDNAAAALVSAGLLACAVGLVLHRMWTVLPAKRCVDLLELGALAILCATVLRRRRGWAWANALALAWLVPLLFFVGIPAALATLLLAAAATALGSLLLPRDGAMRAVFSLPAGLVLIGGTLGWLLSWPIHYRLVYLPLLLAICAWRARTVRDIVSVARQGWNAAVASAPWPAAGAVLVFGLASTGAWLPTMQADDLVYHLGLPSQLLQHGFYVPDPTQQIWALAPWLGDVLQGIAQVLAGCEARGAVNAMWMLSIAASLRSLAATLHADVRTRWCTVALCASLPPLAALAAGMQTELAASALLVALALAIMQPGKQHLTWICAVLVAGLAGLKLGHAFAALVLLLWAIARARCRIEWTRLPLALLLFLALASSSYFRAWLVSGNPLLPLFNDVFRSPVLAPLQLTDMRWHAGFGLDLPWAITFDTTRYLEASAGGFGFVMVALAGAWVLALLRAPTRGIVLAGTAVLMLPLWPMQYARYAFPGLVLLLPALLAATDAALGGRWCSRIVVALCVLNLTFQANANWLLSVNTVHKLVIGGGRTDEVYRRYAPVRSLIATLRARDDSDSVVLVMDAQAPDVAELAGRGRTVSHYAPKMQAAGIAADADASGMLWGALVRDIDARWLLLHPQHLNDAQRAGLARVGAQRADVVGDTELWSVPAGTPGSTRVPP